MRRAVAALAAGLCLASAACTAEPGADPPTATPTATAPPTTTSSTTPTSSAPATTTPGDLKAPVMPAQARENSRAGARAFVQYAIQVLNHSLQAQTGDVLRDISSKRCTICRRLASQADGLTASGGYQVGGVWTPRTFYFIPLEPQDQPIVNVAIDVSAGKFREGADEPVRRIPKGVIRDDFHLRWTSNDWQLIDVVAA